LNLSRFLEGLFETSFSARPMVVARILHFGHAGPEFAFDLTCKRFGADPKRASSEARATRLCHQRASKCSGAFLLFVARGDLLRFLQSFLRLSPSFVESQHTSSLMLLSCH